MLCCSLCSQYGEEWYGSRFTKALEVVERLQRDLTATAGHGRLPRYDIMPDVEACVMHSSGGCMGSGRRNFLCLTFPSSSSSLVSFVSYFPLLPFFFPPPRLFVLLLFMFCLSSCSTPPPPAVPVAAAVPSSSSSCFFLHFFFILFFWLTCSSTPTSSSSSSS